MSKRFFLILLSLFLLLPGCDNDDSTDCGDGVVDEGEECDDGNDVDDDDCSNACKSNQIETKAKCGNGKVETGEQCDDGNDVDDDDCSNACMSNKTSPNDWFSPNPGAETHCGDGKLEAGEICEIGQTNVNHADWTCEDKDGKCVWKTPEAVCGNGVVEDGEECDDANTIAGDGCAKNCKKEDSKICQMRNGSKADVLLVQDGDTLKLRLKNDGECSSKTTVTVRIHGLDCPECLKSAKVSPIDENYKDAQACDEAKKAPCAEDNLYDFATLEECNNHNERGGYEAAVLANELIYSEENKGEAEITCETVSDKDSTCLLDNTRSRYLAYIGVKSNNQSIDLGKAIVSAGLGVPFTAFTSQKTNEYCAAEKDAVSNKSGVWANGDTFEAAANASFGSEKLSWVLDESHCK